MVRSIYLDVPRYQSAKLSRMISKHGFNLVIPLFVPLISDTPPQVVDVSVPFKIPFYVNEADVRHKFLGASG